MLNFVSLFSGSGAFDSGFLRNGFNCIGAYDNDPVAITNYQNNIGNWIYNCDLSNVKGQDLINKSEKIDLVISGSPCQGYSTLGKRKLDDPRNNLLITGGKIAIDLKTSFFVAENVSGSLYGEHSKYWDELKDLFQNNNYKSTLKLINSQDYGLAQTRKRVFFFAWKGGGVFKSTSPSMPPKTLIDVIGNINGSQNHVYVEIDENDPRTEICKRIKEDQKLCDVRGGERAVHSWDIPSYFGVCTAKEKELLLFIKDNRRKIRRRKLGDADPISIDLLKETFGAETEVLVKNLLKKKYITEKEKNYYDLRRSFNGKYRRLAGNKPSLTVDTYFGNPNYFLHPEHNRGLSVREVARIQGFDDTYIFHGELKEQFKLIGNAVPPPVSYHIAKDIYRFLNE